MWVLIAVIGMVLQIPGIIAIALMVTTAISDPSRLTYGPLVGFWAACLAISAAGIFMIRHGLRTRPRPFQDGE